MPRTIPRAEAWELLTEWVESASLRRHCQAVSIAMRAYAGRLGGDVELWEVTGLLHDADYERFSDMDDEVNGHPRSIMRHLEELGAPPEMVRGIASHADFLGVARETPMEKALYAVDAASGDVRWRVEDEAIGAFTPAAAGDLVYIGGNGAMLAFDVADGSEADDVFRGRHTPPVSAGARCIPRGAASRIRRT